MENTSVKVNTKVKKQTAFGQFAKSVKKNYAIYLMLLLPIIYFIVFKYVPMFGNVIAFRKYVPGKSVFGVSWRGLDYFKMFINDPQFWSAFKNTITLSLLTLVVSFPLPIIFALMLNEVRLKRFKKAVQSITIIPKFLSVVVVVMILNTLLSPSNGTINMIIEFFGGEPIYFMQEEFWFRFVYIASNIWQFMGWSSIIYMACLSSADMEQYEAAMVDGASRWKQTIYITIPLLLPTIAINLTISVGNILNVGFEKVLLMYTPATYSFADVVQTFVYRIGLIGSNYSYGAAAGLFQGIISLFLLWVTNYITNKYWKCGLW